MTTPIHQINWTKQKPTIQKVKAHSGISSNKIADTLAIHIATKEESPLRHIYATHSISNLLASKHPLSHTRWSGVDWKLQTILHNEHRRK